MDIILDALFGKRYVTGWPRGVQPMMPGLLKIAQDNPELWEEIRGKPCGVGLAILRGRGLL